MKAVQRDMLWNAIFGAFAGASILLAWASFVTGQTFFGVVFALSAAAHVGICAWHVIDYDEEDT